MSIEVVIESIGLPVSKLRDYLLNELDELLGADSLEAQEKEYTDVLFALKCLAYEHMGVHVALDEERFTAKILERLKKYGTISKKDPVFQSPELKSVSYAAVHFAFGHFHSKRKDIPALKNGTVAELLQLVKNPVGHHDRYVSHLILIFDSVDRIIFEEYWADAEKGAQAVICRIPDFLFSRAKATGDFNRFEECLARQIAAAMASVNIMDNAVVHFHSWEAGLVTASSCIAEQLSRRRLYFSPYLTVNRLKRFAEKYSSPYLTLTPHTLELACKYEQQAMNLASCVLFESKADTDFYASLLSWEKVRIVSYCSSPSKSFCPAYAEDKKMLFIAGGRPVFEKGFIELCDEFHAVYQWAESLGKQAELHILCANCGIEKGWEYIAELQHRISTLGLESVVFVDNRVSLHVLKRSIQNSCGVICSSLYEPFGLMPTYAIELDRAAFVSCYAGVSESVLSREYVYDPLQEGDLLRAIKTWYLDNPAFQFENPHCPYDEVYFEIGK